MSDSAKATPAAAPAAAAPTAAAAAPAPPALLKRAHVIKPKGEHKFTIIWIHGLGDRGESFVDVFEGRVANTRVVLPNAPVIPITANGGYRMPGWYDIKSFGSDRDVGDSAFDKDGILSTMKALTELIDYEKTLVGGNADRIFVGGFSQGGASSLLVGHMYPEQLGGVICASGYLLLAAEASKYLTQKKVPLLVYHGTEDQVVGLGMARATKAALEKEGVVITDYVEERGLQHSMSGQEVGAIFKFLKTGMEAALNKGK